MKIKSFPSPLTGEGWGEGEQKQSVPPSPSSPPTRGGESIELWRKFSDLMRGLEGLVQGPHGILCLIRLNQAGATGDRGADR